MICKIAFQRIMGKKLLTTKIKVFNENFQNFEKQFKEKIFCNFL